MNRYALLAYAGRKLGYTRKELSNIFDVSEWSITYWCSKVNEHLITGEISHLLPSESEVSLSFIDPAKLDKLKRR